jgi:hypothetical protein
MWPLSTADGVSAFPCSMVRVNSRLYSLNTTPLSTADCLIALACALIRV